MKRTHITRWPILLVGLLFMTTASFAHDDSRGVSTIVLKDQGSFTVGGGVITNPGIFDPFKLTPDGQTVHGDFAYVQYQIPPNARQYPLVMWHGGGQMAKTWESTPDGRDGFQNIFVRRGFSTYILDQPNRGRAGRALQPTTIIPVPGPGPTGEQGIFVRFRIGIWPNYFPGVQFSHSPDALLQWWQQQTPSTGPADDEVASDAGAAIFKKTGPAVLLSHSAGGYPGFRTAEKSANVKGIVSFEPVGWTFPAGEAPANIPTAAGDIVAQTVPVDQFLALTKIPVLLIYGDNIPAPDKPSLYPGIDIWRGRLMMAQLFINAINKHGGHAELLHLPDIGVRGNTHFAMSDLNNVAIADLVSFWLKKRSLDKNARGHNYASR